MEKPKNQTKKTNLDIKPDKKKSFLKKILIVIAFILILLAIPLFWIHHLFSTTSPFKAISYMLYHRTHPHQNLSKRTIGYAPSWQLDKMQNIRLDLLTDVIYFSLTIDDQGNFAKKNSKGADEPGWVAWNKKPAKSSSIRGRYSDTLGICAYTG